MVRSIERGIERGGLLETKTISPVGQLWRRFRFPGDPPPPGSIAETRLIQCAEEYIESVIRKAKEQKGPRKEDISGLPTDDLRSEIRRSSSSDKRQRELHNRLGIMVYGSPRTSMPLQMARDLSDFAASIAYPGMGFNEIEEMSLEPESKE